MKQIVAIVAVFVFLSLLAYFYFPNPEADRKTEERQSAERTLIITQFKKYHTAQLQFKKQFGKYAANLSELYEYNGQKLNLIDEDFFKAWNKHSSPDPWNGYLFADVQSQDEKKECGLTAYPQKPSEDSEMMTVFLDELLVFSEDPREADTMSDYFQVWAKPFKADTKLQTTWLTPRGRLETMRRIDKKVDELSLYEVPDEAR